MSDHTYDFPRPALTADVAVFHGAATSRRVLLVLRGAEPFVGRWALPGGFVDEFEPPVDAAVRELAEETTLALEPAMLRLVGAYGRRGRDPRGWTVSTVYATDLGAGADAPDVHGGDDAADARWWPADGLPELAFDHDEIVAAAMAGL